MTSVFRPKTGELEWSWIEIHGPDTCDFLQRLSTVDAKSLLPGQGAPGFFLDAQGKIRSAFHLWRLAGDRFAFELESTGGLKQSLLNWIEQYHFAEKFQVTEASDRQAIWVFPAAVEAGMYFRAENGVSLCTRGTLDFGRPWLTVWGGSEVLQTWLDFAHPNRHEATLADLEGWRIEAARPRPGHELVESFNPLETGTPEGIAQDKGCYPGQEVIEKIISLGSPARRLVRLQGQGPLPARGDKLYNQATPPAEIGEVTSVAARGEGFVALGLVRKIHAKTGLTVQVDSREAKITWV
jgi:folate-binding protein YgfZ